MYAKNLNALLFSKRHSHHQIKGAFSLRTLQAPEQGNLALHVCQNPQDVLKSRMIWQNQTLPLENWVLPWQKHTARVQRVYASDQGKGAYEARTSILETDGLYTTDPNTLIGVFTADCLGILMADPSVPVIAAVHSGWRGTAQAITIQMLEALKKDGLLHPKTLHIYFSPSLMTSSLEVGPEVVEQIQEMANCYGLNLQDCIFPGQNDRSYLNNQAVNMRMALGYGIPLENLHASNLDTKTNPYGFSYRRDGKKTGEHFSCLWIESLLKE